MPGIYNRDNLAQQLAQAIELAQQRRERNRAIESQRNSENVKAATDFAKALGRTYETWDSNDEEKLAALQKEREEALAAQMAGYVPMSRYTDAMAGYVPTESVYSARPNYNDIINRRGLLQ